MVGMRKKKLLHRFIKWYAAGLMAGFLCAVTGCAATPDSGIVRQKNNERLKEAAKEGADENNNLAAIAKQADSHYDYQFENEAKTLRVTADADVWLPDKDRIPMYEVTSGEFSQELVTKVYNYFFQEDTYRYEGIDFTKEKCEERILELEQQLAEVMNDADRPEEEKEEVKEEIQFQIDEYKGEYDDLPEKSTLKKVPVNSILTDQVVYTEKGKETLPGLNCESDTGWLFVDNFPPDYSAWSSMSYQKKGGMNYEPSEGGDLSENNVRKKAEQEIGMTCEEAKKVVDDFFGEIGMPVKECAVSAVSGYYADTKEQDVIKAVDHYTAYRFFYTRTIDDIPFAATTDTHVNGDSEAPLWCYEQIEICVDPQGIVQFRWDFPVEVKDTVSENVGIISFADAAEIFEQMMPVVYEGQMEEEYAGSDVTAKMDIEVTSVELALMRVRDSGSERKGLLTPTWVFYGKETTYYQSRIEVEQDFEHTEETPWIVLAVNAVDGTVIHIVEGY